MSTLNKNELWNNALKIIEKKMHKSSFDTWFAKTRLVSFFEDYLIVSTPDNFTKQWLEDNYMDLIKETLFSFTSRHYKISFVVSGDKKNSRNSSDNADDGKQPLNLNQRYTFDTFVVGNSNRFAHAACLAVAESIAKAYNPLFIYGGVGLGKTHLMHAIGHHVYKENKNAKILYVTTEKFTNELIDAIKDDKNTQFRNKYRNMDVLLIDDIQFLAKKERTQEEFFHTFNALYEANKQIIISSDRPPKEIPTLEERLRTRFEWGLISDIQAPDFETRIAILRKKAQNENIYVSDDVLSYIADNINSNIRELEGALIRIVAFASLTNSEINFDLAKKALSGIIDDRPKAPLSCDYIQEKVASAFSIKITDLKSKKRTRSITYPRQIAMFLSREMTEMTLPQIGAAFGGRDHTTVMHAIDKINNDISNDITFSKSIEDIRKDILNN